VARDGVLKTQIMYRANLSFAQLNEYLNLLVKIDLLKVARIDGRKIYKTTEKGLSYLERYREILQLLDESENGENNGGPFKRASLRVIKNVHYLR